MGKFYYIVYVLNCNMGDLYFELIDEYPLQWLKRGSYNTTLLFFTEIPEEEYTRWHNDNKD